jgi:hypothetical protein
MTALRDAWHGTNTIMKQSAQAIKPRYADKDAF